jgi:hypothetical protein
LAFGNTEINKQETTFLCVIKSLALRVALHYPDQSISYMELYKISNGATPLMFAKYKLALLLYKTSNGANA